jgi:pre-mRNA-processing factor 19
MSDSSGAKSGTSSKMICSLSGQDCADPVVTPSGYICERRLLLSKLVDTGGNDPFRADVVLHESDLVSLQKPKESSLIPPPRLETATSFTHLLQLMQHEHDALLLELYDTRKALEETRMELSQALYQNDAAVRVIARVTMERDQAKQDLMNYQPQAGAVSATPTVGGTSAAPAPSMVVQDEPAAQPAPPEAMQVEEEAGVEPPPTKDNVVPDEDMKLLIDSWQQLSSQRKARKKQKADPAIHSVSPEELGQFQALESKSLHKSNKPGVVALATVGDYVASAGKDKSVIVYSRVKDQILHNLAVPSSSAAFTSVDIVQIPTTIDKSPSLQTLVATGDASGAVRCYAELTDPEDGSSVMRPLGDVKSGLGLSEEKESVVSVAFHPSGKFIFATTANGHVTMIKIVQPSESVADGTMEILMTLNSLDQLQLEKELRVTAGALHPDGLIYLVGLSDGSLQVWDLKTQSLASTLTVRVNTHIHICNRGVAFSLIDVASD